MSSAITPPRGRGQANVFNLADVWVVAGVLLLLLAPRPSARRPTEGAAP